MSTETLPAPQVVIVGALPPPVNGMALVTEAVKRLITSKFNAVVCNVSPTTVYGKHPAMGIGIKLLRHILLWLRLPLLRLRGVKTLYMPLDSQRGLYFNIITLGISRLLCMRFILHHHVANYVVEPSLQMRCVNALTNRRDLQIFNCQNLLQRFQQAYPRRSPMQHVSNSGLIDIEIGSAVDRTTGSTLVLGMLAVLTMEKGLGVLLDLLDAIEREQLDVRMVIAGPVHQAEAKERLDAAIAKHPTRLDYRGAVGGESKLRFFEDIDVFVFPTLYRLETEPLVVIEALSYRRPLITFARGCIGEIVGTSGGTVIAVDADFVAGALEVCRHYLQNPAALEAAKAAAGARAEERASQARNASLLILEAIADGPGAANAGS